MSSTTPPDALLLLTSHCPHCSTVLQGLSELVKNGRIGRLEAVNIEARPDVAERHGVRSVPWIRIGDFELEGLHSPTELATWAARAGSPSGIAEGITELLENGQLGKVIRLIEQHPEHLDALLRLAADPDTDLAVRIGISAAMEDLEHSDTLRDRLPALLELSQHTDPRVRADACHFLMLTGLPEARDRLQALANDPEPTVREAARNALEDLTPP